MNCTYCSTELPADAMFCGECGRSVVVTASRAGSASDTAIVPGIVRGALVRDGLVEPVTRSPAQPGLAESEATPVFLSAPEPVEYLDERVTSAPEPGELPVSSAPEIEHVAGPDPDVPPSQHFEDFEATRIVRSGPTGARFVLQFSTGESHTVFGTGLIGRNPVAEPGEYFDQRIAIADPGKSVSKTHLEFGQSSGQFWVSDRYSGNGTIVRQPDATPLRCDAGKRYIVARGARIDMGEQFFVVS